MGDVLSIFLKYFFFTSLLHLSTIPPGINFKRTPLIDSICKLIWSCVVAFLMNTDTFSFFCRCLRREPWNHNARYLLIVNLLQKAREERFPKHLCALLERLITMELSSELYSKPHTSFQYQKFLLFLCASEICLQVRNVSGCIKHAENATALSIPDGYLFFGHLMLCRAYAAEGNSRKLEEEYVRCLELKTEYLIGWICLKIMESQYEIQGHSNVIDMNFEKSSQMQMNSTEYWVAIFSLMKGLFSVWNGDLVLAEKYVAEACRLAGSDSCFLLCHGIYYLLTNFRLSVTSCSSKYETTLVLV